MKSNLLPRVSLSIVDPWRAERRRASGRGAGCAGHPAAYAARLATIERGTLLPTIRGSDRARARTGGRPARELSSRPGKGRRAGLRLPGADGPGTAFNRRGAFRAGIGGAETL